MKRESVNYTKYKSGQRQGHYESFFMRANHPSLPLAFWIRYTIFSPNNHPENAIGELWAIYFNGINHTHVVVKKEVPISKCVFDNHKFFVRIADSLLQPNQFIGDVATNGNTIAWSINFSGNSEPLFMFPEKLYEGSFPKAKLLVGLPLAVFTGGLKVNNEIIDITGWVGSQNHNWGVKHTDNYAWGQVAGFDNNPESFFEVSTARLKLGPVWTPFMTLMVLRHKGKEFRLNSIMQALKANGRFKYFTWEFQSRNDEVEISGEIQAQPHDFVGLKYYNPPGGIKHCLNTKVASCIINIDYLKGHGSQQSDWLETKNRTAFEILTDDNSHGIEMCI